MLYFSSNDNHYKGLFVLKKIFCALILFQLQLEANVIPASCAYLLNKNQDHICYVGSLDFKLKQTEQLSLYYDGNIVKVNNGVYCFKEHKSIKKFYFLFVNPEYIQFISDRNTATSYLTFTNNIPYEFYRLKPVNAVNLKDEPLINWDIKRKPMSKQQKNNSLRVVIPNHTVIIPLASDYFKHAERENIVFEYEALKGNSSVIKLPTPQCSAELNREKFIEALLQANLCVINLKNIHTPPEVKTVHMDNHTLIQEGS